MPGAAPLCQAMDTVDETDLHQLRTVGAETLVRHRQQLEELRGVVAEARASHLALELGTAQTKGPEPDDDLVPGRGDRLDPGGGELGGPSYGAGELREGGEREVIRKSPERARREERENDNDRGRASVAAHGGQTRVASR